MPTIVETLQRYPEPLPDWLQQAAPTFDRERFFGSRTVYYPGSGIDGHPVEICAPAHAAHAFVYVDYGVPKDDIRDRVRRVRGQGFLGYEVEHEEDVPESALRPGGWVPHLTPSNAVCEWYRSFAHIRPFAWYVVLRRERDRDHAHGPARLALLFVGGDGFATYDALYCQEDGTNPPFLAVLQDHGFSGNYDKFCAGGLLERIASGCGVYPEWLLVGQNGNQWEGYVDAGAQPDSGGMYNTPRTLFRRAPTASANASPTKFSSTSQTLTGWRYGSHGDG